MLASRMNIRIKVDCSLSILSGASGILLDFGKTRLLWQESDFQYRNRVGQSELGCIFEILFLCLQLYNWCQASGVGQ